MEQHAMTVGHFFFVLASVWIVAKVLGEIATRLGQPAVLGELIAGVLLGPSVLAIVPHGNETLHLLAEVGVAILLFEIGLETDLKEMLSVDVQAILVAVTGVALPMLFGFLLTDALGDAGWFGAMTPQHARLLAIFVGATLTATSVGITARVLADLGAIHRRESKIILGAAVADDVIGIVILAVVSTLAAMATAAGGGAPSLSIWEMLRILVVASGFLVVAVVVGNYLVRPLFRLVEQVRVRGFLIVSSLSLALGIAWLADLAGSAMIIGAFAAGLILSGTNQFDLITEQVKPVADILTPIFFVMVGSAVDLSVFNPMVAANHPILLFGIMLTTVAVIGKVMAGFVVYERGLKRILIGVGMIPRGEVGLIFAQQGLAAGLLTTSMYSSITVMVMATTFIALPLLKFVIPREGEGAAEN